MIMIMTMHIELTISKAMLHCYPIEAVVLKI